MFKRLTLALLSSACLILSSCGPKKSPDSISDSSTQAAPNSALTEEETPQQPPSRLFVRESFQTKSQFGLHDFPRGAEVTLLEVQGDEYLVERDGISVQISKEFFSETPPEPTPTPNSEPPQNLTTINPPPPSTQLTPSPTSPTQQPTLSAEKNNDESLNEASADYLSSKLPDHQTTPDKISLPTSPSPLPLTEEQIKIERLTESLRALIERIRALRESLNESDDTGDIRELKALEKKRDQLSAELSELAKP